MKALRNASAMKWYFSRRLPRSSSGSSWFSVIRTSSSVRPDPGGGIEATDSLRYDRRSGERCTGQGISARSSARRKPSCSRMSASIRAAMSPR